LDPGTVGSIDTGEDREAAIRWVDAPDSLVGGGDPEEAGHTFNKEEYFVVSLSDHSDEEVTGDKTRAHLRSLASSETGSSLGQERGQASEVDASESPLGSVPKETRELAGEGDQSPNHIRQSISRISSNHRREGSSVADSARVLRPDCTPLPQVELVDQCGVANDEDRIKAFCAKILKLLAPPLLQEIEASRRLSVEAEPFKPRRITRRAAAAPAVVHSKQIKRATAAGTTLLKALGITPEDLLASNEDIQSLQTLFDSPLSLKHLRVVASIFGKVMPKELNDEAPVQREGLVH
jgi:hypothetical protein